jgi:hypothetical protein
MYTIAGLVTVYLHIKLYPITIIDSDVDESVKVLERQKICDKITKKRKEKGSKKNTNF